MAKLNELTDDALYQYTQSCLFFRLDRLLGLSEFFRLDRLLGLSEFFRLDRLLGLSEFLWLDNLFRLSGFFIHHTQNFINLFWNRNDGITEGGIKPNHVVTYLFVIDECSLHVVYSDRNAVSLSFYSYVFDDLTLCRFIALATSTQIVVIPLANQSK